MRIHLFAIAILAFVAPCLRADDPTPPEVRIPLYPNRNCPIMAKRASSALFVDTPLGRIYMCCAPCNLKILANPAIAHRAAFPVLKTVANATCPVSGRPIASEAVDFVLQGYRFKLCCPDCAARALADSQVVLTKVVNPAVRDVGNRRCPATGDPVAPNTPCLIGDDLIRLSSPDCLAAIQRDPAGMLARAKAIAAEDRAKDAASGSGSTGAGK